MSQAQPISDPLVTSLRTLPTGILLMIAFLLILGVSALAGGVYLLLRAEPVSAWAVGTGLVGGPAILYLAFHMRRLERWTWMTLMVMLALMAASSVVRLVVSPGPSIAPIGELVIEAAAAFYLTRPSVRDRFGG